MKKVVSLFKEGKNENYEKVYCCSFMYGSSLYEFPTKTRRGNGSGTGDGSVTY